MHWCCQLSMYGPSSLEAWKAQLGIHGLWLSRAAALDYSALETAVVMLAVRLADGWNLGRRDRGGLYPWDGWRVTGHW
jgi:hypothetical protein